MNALAELTRTRAHRNALKAELDSRLAIVRGDVAARGVGGRMADSAAQTAQDVLDEAIEVADENRAVVAGTIAALVVWFLRTPLMALAEDAYARIRKSLD